MSEQPGERRGEFLAYFVGGPDNGVTRWMLDGTMEWRVLGQRAVASLTDLRPDLSMSAISLRYHLYKRAMPLSNPYLRGCWVFEWMGER